MEKPNVVEIRDVLVDAWGDFKLELQQVPLRHFNESVFRYIFVRSLLRLYPNTRCDLEWKRIDLLYVDDLGPSIVEFKFFVRNYHMDTDGTVHKRPKGGAGQKNFGEFCKCVEKLSQIDSGEWERSRAIPFRKRYLVVSYSDPKDISGPESYGYWYDYVALPDHLEKCVRVEQIDRLQTMTCPTTLAMIKAVVFQVSPINASK